MWLSTEVDIIPSSFCSAAVNAVLSDKYVCILCIALLQLLQVE